MLIPIRCYTCNKVIASQWDKYQELTSENTPANEIWKQIGFQRICCKRMFLGHKDLIDEMLAYSTHPYERTNQVPREYLAR
jgi:DNA-directed RNA polymerase subunit N (RpoN/RPB10)